MFKGLKKFFSSSWEQLKEIPKDIKKGYDSVEKVPIKKNIKKK